MLGPWRGLALTAALMVTATNPLPAQGIGLDIADPVPEDLLRTIRPADAEAAFGATRIVDRQGRWRESGMLILRVEADCRTGLCVTVIARVTAAKLTPDVMLDADIPVEFADDRSPLRGTIARRIRIEGAGDPGTQLRLRERMWFVEPCGGGFPSDEERVRRLPPRSSPRSTFEEFRRSLSLDP